MTCESCNFGLDLEIAKFLNSIFHFMGTNRFRVSYICYCLAMRQFQIQNFNQIQ